MGIELIRKALFVATLGLSGRLWKESPKEERAVKAEAQRERPRKQAKATRTKPQTARRAKPQAARRAKPQAARASTIPPIIEAGNGTTNELERLADLHMRGALTDEEFAAAKARILGTSRMSPEADTGPARFPAVETNVAAARHLAELAARDDASVTTFSSD